VPDDPEVLTIKIFRDHGTNELNYSSLRIENIKVFNLGIKYDKEFREQYAKMLHFFKAGTDSGLILLFGKIGTGKTTFVKHLIHQTDRQVFFIPNHLIDVIKPELLIKCLINNRDAIVVIEDDDGRMINDLLEISHPILNFLDSLIADALGIIMICVSNTESAHIKQPYLRTGKLIASCAFS
jgi:hypothetical protein